MGVNNANQTGSEDILSPCAGSCSSRRHHQNELVSNIGQLIYHVVCSDLYTEGRLKYYVCMNHLAHISIYNLSIYVFIPIFSVPRPWMIMPCSLLTLDRGSQCILFFLFITISSINIAIFALLLVHRQTFSSQPGSTMNQKPPGGPQTSREQRLVSFITTIHAEKNTPSHTMGPNYV